MTTTTSVMYLVTEPWYFANHRLDHARALIAAGFDVHVATRRGERWDELVTAGCIVHEIEMARGSGTAIEWLREIRTARGIVRSARPDIVHAVALKPLAISLFLVPMRRRPALILSVNGLGLSASHRGIGVRVIRTVIRAAARLPRVTLLFQTRADRTAVVGTASRGIVIPGVGVDTVRFHPAVDRPTPPPCVVVYLGRAVVSKGLLDLAAAMTDGAPAGVELHLYCSIDGESPGSLDADDLASIAASPAMTLHPPTRWPELVLRSAHAAILPSRAGEGVSKFVLEALASGTPVLLSAESGSAEVLVPDAGIVFTAGDPASIRAALAEVASWSDERRSAASSACREAAERSYSLAVIAPQIVELHRRAVTSRIHA